LRCVEQAEIPPDIPFKVICRVYDDGFAKSEWGEVGAQLRAELMEDYVEVTVAEVATFLDYLQYRLEHAPQQTPYKPVALGGLWEGVTITDEDIAEVRREMWGNFGEREP